MKYLIDTQCVRAHTFRCETSGSDYAIYWTKTKTRPAALEATAFYVTPQRMEDLERMSKPMSFAESSSRIELSANGNNAVAQV